MAYVGERIKWPPGGVRIWGLGARVKGLGCLGFRVSSSGLRASAWALSSFWELGLRVEGSGIRCKRFVPGSWIRAGARRLAYPQFLADTW